MRHLSIIFRSGIIMGCVLFVTGCKIGNGAASRPSNATFVLCDACADFYAQNHRWPKTFAELWVYDQQSRSILKHEEYDQVEFTYPKDGRLGILVVSDGVTNSGMLSAHEPKGSK